MTDEKQYYIYLYSDPKTGDPVYVGKGSGRRAFHHKRPSVKTNQRLKNLIRSRTKDGYEINPQILVIGSENYIHFMETRFIPKFEALILSLVTCAIFT